MISSSVCCSFPKLSYPTRPSTTLRLSQAFTDVFTITTVSYLPYSMIIIDVQGPLFSKYKTPIHQVKHCTVKHAVMCYIFTQDELATLNTSYMYNKNVHLVIYSFSGSNA